MKITDESYWAIVLCIALVISCIPTKLILCQESDTAQDVKTAITFSDKPEFEKSTNIHLTATLLTDWPERNYKVTMTGTGIIVRKITKGDLIWRSPKKGEKFEADFRIRPVLLGASLFHVDYERWGYTNYITLDSAGKFLFQGTMEDAWASVTPQKYSKSGMPVLTKGQEEIVSKLTMKSIFTAPIIDSNKITIKYPGISIVISPIPRLNKISKVTIQASEGYADEPLQYMTLFHSNLVYYKNHNKNEFTLYGLKDYKTLRYSKDADFEYSVVLYIKPIKVGGNYINLDFSHKPQNVIAWNYSIVFYLDDNGYIKDLSAGNAPKAEIKK